MKYLLDTNVCIKYLKGNSSNIYNKLNSVDLNDVCICSVVRYELFYGAYKSNKQNETLEKINSFLNNFGEVSFDYKAAEICGKLRAELDMKGTPIGPYDLQIASVALVNDLTLVTNNVKEFGRISGLSIEDWESN